MPVVSPLSSSMKICLSPWNVVAALHLVICTITIFTAGKAPKDEGLPAAHFKSAAKFSDRMSLLMEDRASGNVTEDAALRAIERFLSDLHDDLYQALLSSDSNEETAEGNNDVLLGLELEDVPADDFDTVLLHFIHAAGRVPKRDLVTTAVQKYREYFCHRGLLSRCASNSTSLKPSVSSFIDFNTQQTKSESTPLRITYTAPPRGAVSSVGTSGGPPDAGAPSSPNARDPPSTSSVNSNRNEAGIPGSSSPTGVKGRDSKTSQGQPAPQAGPYSRADNGSAPFGGEMGFPTSRTNASLPGDFYGPEAFYGGHPSPQYWPPAPYFGPPFGYEPQYYFMPPPFVPQPLLVPGPEATQHETVGGSSPQATHGRVPASPRPAAEMARSRSPPRSGYGGRGEIRRYGGTPPPGAPRAPTMSRPRAAPVAPVQKPPPKPSEKSTPGPRSISPPPGAVPESVDAPDQGLGGSPSPPATGRRSTANIPASELGSGALPGLVPEESSREPGADSSLPRGLLPLGADEAPQQSTSLLPMPRTRRPDRRTPTTTSTARFTEPVTSSTTPRPVRFTRPTDYLPPERRPQPPAGLAALSNGGSPPFSGPLEGTAPSQGTLDPSYMPPWMYSSWQAVGEESHLPDNATGESQEARKSADDPRYQALSTRFSGPSWVSFPSVNVPRIRSISFSQDHLPKRDPKNSHSDADARPHGDRAASVAFGADTVGRPPPGAPKPSSE
ncbi:hypothetical protein CSUI_009094, partial [Cystoisospora suis]